MNKVFFRILKVVPLAILIAVIADRGIEKLSDFTDWKTWAVLITFWAAIDFYNWAEKKANNL